MNQSAKATAESRSVNGVTRVLDTHISRSAKTLFCLGSVLRASRSC